MNGQEIVAGEQMEGPYSARFPSAHRRDNRSASTPRPRLRLPAPLEALNDGPHDPDDDTWIGHLPEPAMSERRARQQLRAGIDPRTNVRYLPPRAVPDPIFRPHDVATTLIAVFVDLVIDPIRQVLRFVGRISTTGEVVERPPP